MQDLNKTVAELEAEKQAETYALGDTYEADKEEINHANRKAMAKLGAWFDVASDTIGDKYRDALNAADLRDCPRCHGTRVVSVWDQARGVDVDAPCDERTYDGASTHGQLVIDAREDAEVEAHRDTLASRDWLEVSP